MISSITTIYFVFHSPRTWDASKVCWWSYFLALSALNFCGRGYLDFACEDVSLH